MSLERIRDSTRNERSLWLLLGMTVAGALVRFATLELQSFHHDEAVTAIRVLDRSFVDMLDQVAEAERSGPLYYMLAWLWAQPFGIGETALRSLSAILGTLMIPVAYLAGAKLASWRAGLIVAGLVAVNPLLIWYSQEARSYALFVLLSAVALVFFAAAIRRFEGRALAYWAAFSVAALATHYFAAFLIAPQAIWLLYFYRARAVAAVGATALGGAALLPLAVSQGGGDRANAFTDDSLIGRLVDTGIGFSLGGDAGISSQIWGIRGSGAVLGALAVALGVVGLVLLVRRAEPPERLGGLLALLIGASAVVLPFALALVGLDLVKPRNFVGAVIPLLVAVAIGFAARDGKRFGITGAATLGALFVIGSAAVVATPSLQRDDWQGIAEAIGPTSEARFVIARSTADDPLIFYLDGGVAKVRESSNDGKGRGPKPFQARVSEIVVVTKLAARARLMPGFILADEQARELAAVHRYRAATPRRVDAAELEGMPLVGRNFTVLLQTRDGGRVLSVAEARRLRE